MDRKIGLVVAAVSVGCAWGARADLLAVSRNSSINAGLITVAPAPAPVSSTLVDSAADLTLSGAAGYSDGFGREFAGSYASAQDVDFGSLAISAQLSQSADTTLISAGNPASTVFSVDVFNRYESSFTVTEETMLRLTLNYTGTVTLGSAADRVDFRINTQFGGMFVMPLAVPSGQYTNETLVQDFTFLPGTTYFLVADGRAFSGGGAGPIASELSFSLAPIPGPSTMGMLAVSLLGPLARRRR